MSNVDTLDRTATLRPILLAAVLSLTASDAHGQILSGEDVEHFAGHYVVEPGEILVSTDCPL
ncbi:MAG: hypothetical protein R3195_17485 [Gemmatimonadota bacterium]|nr:hypothetical protein [Gemmatimonadota bacterium]